MSSLEYTLWCPHSQERARLDETKHCPSDPAGCLARSLRPTEPMGDRLLDDSAHAGYTRGPPPR